MEKHFVDITPDKTLIKKLGLTGYRTEQALAELIDNSIDARIHKEPEEIITKLDFTHNRIEISDTGQGMNKEEITTAMTIAKGIKGPDKLGHFGIGMKSACSALGKRFTVTTRKVGTNKVFIAEYDEEKWLSDKTTGWREFLIIEKDAEDEPHGTKIEISNLNVPLYANQASLFKERFGIRYEPYLTQDQVRIQINTINVKPLLPEIEERTKQPIQINTLTGVTIKGWVALLKKRSIRGNWGIHLFRHGRLIKAYDKFGIPNHPSYAKIIGKLDLDHVPVNFHKSEFIEESPEYKEAEAAFVNDLVVKQLMKDAVKATGIPASVNSVIGYLASNKKSTSAGYMDTRVRADVAKQILNEAKETPLPTKHGIVTIKFDDKKDPLYSIERSDRGIVVVINKNNEAFSFVKNPLFLIGLIGIEVELAASNPKILDEFIDSRNLRLSTLLQDWRKKEERHGRDVMQQTLPNYGIVNDLLPIYNALTERYENKFQFTSLSTLATFLHYSLQKIVYSIYTTKSAGQYLTDLLEGVIEELASANLIDRGQYTVLLDPDEKELNTAMNVSGSRNFLIVRETSLQLGFNMASPEKAWIDLFMEVHNRQIPVPDVELRYILETLSRYKLVDKNQLLILADYHKMRSKIAPIINEVL